MITLNGKYGEAKVYTDIIEEEAISQIIQMLNQEYATNANVAIMPDVHAGAGCTIGTTMRLVNNCVVPNLVGVDIGCGVMCAKIVEKDIDFEKLDKVIRENVPSGMSINATALKAAKKWADELPNLRCWTAIKSKEDYFLKSIGTLGGGNHYIEIDVDEKGNHYLVVHTGSRNLGVQVCTYYQKQAEKDYLQNFNQIKKKTIDIMLKDGEKTRIEAFARSEKPSYNKELLPVTGNTYLDYLNDMNIVQDYAFYNRFNIVRTIFTKMGWHEDGLFETIHNYIDFSQEYPILRKGAVAAYKNEKLIIPMNMRDGALICLGKGNAEWNYSAPHGAGRLMSRAKAKAQLSMIEFQDEMNGIWTSCVSNSTIDESPMAYKPMESILENIGDTVEVLEIIKPIYNYKAN